MLGINYQIPDVKLATMKNGEITEHSTKDLFGQGLNILVGLPGVFTPICTKDHIPSLIAHADTLKAKGVKGIYCIADDNPWAMEAWAASIPGSEKITFLSDGNRDFIKSSKTACGEKSLFLGEKYARFYAIIKDGAILRVRQEATVMKTICTTGECIVSDLEDALNHR